MPRLNRDPKCNARQLRDLRNKARRLAGESLNLLDRLEDGPPPALSPRAAAVLAGTLGGLAVAVKELHALVDDPKINAANLADLRQQA